MSQNDISSMFSSLQRSGKKALIAYLAAGYPGFSEQEKLIRAMVEAGIDALELGIPFSDPIADGPTIQFASQEALKSKTTLRDVFAFATSMKKKGLKIPLIFMTYLNPLLAYGEKRFAADAARAGVCGVIIPDLIPEEADALTRILDRAGVAMIHLVAPTTPHARQKRIASQTRGFLYAVSVAGVTGARRALPRETKSWLKKLSRRSPSPVCVGFGISGPKQIKELRDSVDGFIVGSALIDVIRNHTPARRIPAMRKLIQSLAKECHRGR